jgi:F0F1-type ATP synthase membrane subunit a
MILLLANEAAHGAGVSTHDSVIMFSTLVVVSVIIASAVWARSQVGTVPKGMAAVYEHMFDWLDGIAQGFMGKEGRNYVPLTLSFFLFILMSNWMGMVPLPPSLHRHHSWRARPPHPSLRGTHEFLQHHPIFGGAGLPSVQPARPQKANLPTKPLT